MTVPAISVAMSVYNGERFLAEAVDSIIAQTFTDFEFLILDDGSSDGSLAMLRTYAAKDSRIRIITRENRGLIVSLNQLLDEARAPIIARMDSDDICYPTRFEKQIAFLEANPDHGVIGAWSEDIDEHGAHYPLAGGGHELTHQALIAGIDGGGQLICHPVAMYRTSVVREAGGYHAAFRHCEDYDLWLRLASQTKLANLPERLIKYRRYSGQISHKHATEQAIGAAISRIAYRERMAGRVDPTIGLDCLPSLGELDTLFGHKGLTREVRGSLSTNLRYSPEALRGKGLGYIIDHLRDGGPRQGMWRTVARLMRIGEPARAVRLARTLVLG